MAEITDEFNSDDAQNVLQLIVYRTLLSMELRSRHLIRVLMLTIINHR